MGPVHLENHGGQPVLAVFAVTTFKQQITSSPLQPTYAGLQIPSTSVFRTVEYCEHVFKATVTGKDGKQISSESNLKKKMIVNVCQHFTLNSSTGLFTDHGDDDNEFLADDHRTNLMKRVADKYFTLRLYNFGKKYVKEIVKEGKQSDRHLFNEITLFKNY